MCCLCHPQPSLSSFHNHRGKRSKQQRRFCVEVLHASLTVGTFCPTEILLVPLHSEDNAIPLSAIVINILWFLEKTFFYFHVSLLTLPHRILLFGGMFTTSSGPAAFQWGNQLRSIRALRIDLRGEAGRSTVEPGQQRPSLCCSLLGSWLPPGMSGPQPVSLRSQDSHRKSGPSGSAERATRPALCQLSAGTCVPWAVLSEAGFSWEPHTVSAQL